MKIMHMAAKWLGRTGLAGMVSLALYLGVMQLSGNVHTVIPDELYRSGQLTPEMIESLIRTDGIRTILNLRGENPSQDWYEDEIEVSTRLGVHHIDFPMSSRKILEDTRIKAIVTLMRDSPKPLLVHCMGGSDRSGLVSALYLRYIANRPAGEAGRQLSLYFGHFAVPLLSKAYAMDQSWDNLLLEKTVVR